MDIVNNIDYLYLPSLRFQQPAPQFIAELSLLNRVYCFNNRSPVVSLFWKITPQLSPVVTFRFRQGCPVSQWYDRICADLVRKFVVALRVKTLIRNGISNIYNFLCLLQHWFKHKSIVHV
jgi:hypothetical protein